MGDLINGWIIGASVALAVGPVVVLLLRISVVRPWGAFGLSAFGTALSFGVSMTIALCGAEYAQSLVERWPAFVHLVLASLVLYTAWRAYMTNKGITIEMLARKRSVRVSLWQPPILSLLCPFTSILILNIFSSQGLLTRSLDLATKAAFVIGSVAGQFTVFFGYGVFLHMISRTFSHKVVLLLAKGAPLIIAYYGTRGLFTGLSFLYEQLY